METLPQKDLNETHALLAMLLCSILWSTSSLLIKLIPWPSVAIAGIRSLFAFLFFFIYLQFFTKNKFIFNKNVLFVGAFVSLKYISFVFAIKLTAAANATSIHLSNVIYVLIASSIMSKKMPHKRDIAVIISTMIGISLFFMGKFDASGFWGNILAGVTGISTAVMFFCSGRFKSFEENLSSITVGNLLTACICLPFSIGMSLDMTPVALGSLFFLAFIQQGTAYLLYSKAIRVVKPFACAMIAALEPIISPILVFLVIGERPSKYALVGAIIVIGSITTWTLADFKIREKEAAESALKETTA